jgi:transcription elongation factor GreB
MSKAFTKESDQTDDDAGAGTAPINGLALSDKNYMTPHGYKRLRDEFDWLMKTERPEVTAVVSWAAGNGDRSENGDYQYGKKRLREIDRRIRYLTKRIEHAEVIDPANREETDQAFFGATVTYANAAGDETTVRIVGVDEMDVARGYVTWISPIARTLLKAREGDVVLLHTPAGAQEIDVLEVKYEEIAIDPFTPPVGAWKPNAK